VLIWLARVPGLSSKVLDLVLEQRTVVPQGGFLLMSYKEMAGLSADTASGLK
jgi:hypothetical protein